MWLNVKYRLSDLLIISDSNKIKKMIFILSMSMNILIDIDIDNHFVNFHICLTVEGRIADEISNTRLGL